MRYEDWDVLLFPRDCKVPLREFRVACHVVQDLEFSHIHGSAGVPTVCCFVPSLIPGTPFQVSLHSWTGLPRNQLAQEYSNFSDSVRLEARVYIDGRPISSAILDQNTNWPRLFTHCYATTMNGQPEALGFPSFRYELLQQSYWSPADSLGRIKIVISEGFSRNSSSNPIERVRNIVAFSFQHAPLDVLEDASIAWPSPSMWERAPFAATSLGPPRTNQEAELPTNTSLQWCDDLEPKASGAVPSNGPVPVQIESNKLDGRKTQTAPWGLSGASFTSTSFQDEEADEDMRSKVLTITPTARQNSWYEADATRPDHSTTSAPISLLPRGSLTSPSFSHSLTKSILNQPPPVQVQSSGHELLSQTVRSRKEMNNPAQRLNALPPATVPTATDLADSRPTRKVSQAISLISTESGVSASTGGASLSADMELSRTDSPLYADSHPGSQVQVSELEIRRDVTKGFVPTNTLSVSSGNTVNKGIKRVRNFTPGSSKALDDENDSRHVSPRLDVTCFGSSTEQDDRVI